MAGEFKIAQQAIRDAMETAAAENSMSQDAMGRALLAELLQALSKQSSSAELKDMVDYQLENLSTDSFVITRGC
ncbi:MAG: hypothetical protein CL693_10370 [Cellvibrionaceae bacterium]|nr:hypothetical protein [Cellvibrionaceae bacterium]|tara:strand:+ start:1877 stop:2098 length:222 start_codon:yes stop_codon:yes gene_type:complete